jgi:hypothetical protein
MLRVLIRWLDNFRTASRTEARGPTRSVGGFAPASDALPGAPVRLVLQEGRQQR